MANNTPDSDDDSPPENARGGPAKPIGLKFILVGILLLIYLGYLFYVGFSDPR